MTNCCFASGRVLAADWIASTYRWLSMACVCVCVYCPSAMIKPSGLDLIVLVNCYSISVESLDLAIKNI